ncbi:MAG TPA: response regulator [Verrucomicrobiae bacterium]|nr:response regulator [Verrucomicrobiae bacterium]
MSSGAILLVEDNPDDVFIMSRALQKAGLQLPVFTVNDGKEAMDYLGGSAPFADRSKYPLPSMVFLDLKLPYFNGFEVLEWIRQREGLNGLQVIILTSSGEDRDQRRAQDIGVQGYLIKPPKPDALRQLVAPLLESSLYP